MISCIVREYYKKGSSNINSKTFANTYIDETSKANHVTLSECTKTSIVSNNEIYLWVNRGNSNIIHVHGKCTKVLEVNLKFNEHENLKKNIAPRVHLIIQQFLNIELNDITLKTELFIFP